MNKNNLIASIPFLKDCRLVQPELNTIDTFVTLSGGSVKLQFLAGLGSRQGRVKLPLICDDIGLQLASLEDLLATKLNTIQGRAQLKDYVDIYALLRNGLSLEYGLGCAQAIYGKPFDPATSLKALTSYVDGDLQEVPLEIKKYLTKQAIHVESIPIIQPLIMPTHSH